MAGGGVSVTIEENGGYVIHGIDMVVSLTAGIWKIREEVGMNGISVVLKLPTEVYNVVSGKDVSKLWLKTVPIFQFKVFLSVFSAQ